MSEPTRRPRRRRSQFQFHGEVFGIRAARQRPHQRHLSRHLPAPGAPVRYILQHINRHVFHDPVAVMQNIERVTAHLAAQAAGEPDGARRALRL